MTATAQAIPMFDYVEQYNGIREEILDAIEGVLSSGTLVLGPRVEAFERNFARYLGVDGQAIGVGSGTDALAIALRATGVVPGDEVITVANTAIPTVSAIRMADAMPVFAEIEPDTLLMDLDSAAARITPRTKAIMPVHLFGGAVDMPRVMELAREHGLAVIEDCAQSCGTTWGGQMTGTFGHVGCFSFYPTKNLGGYGDGGLCYTRDRKLAEAMRQIRCYGRGPAYDCQREGVNSRLDELQAAVLDVKLRHLDDYLAARRRVAATYNEHLPKSLARPVSVDAVDPSYHLFVIATERRAELIARLAEHEIGYGIHYPKPVHRMRGYEFLGYREGSLPITERMAEQVLSLPCYPELSLEAVRRIASVVRNVTE